MVSGYPAREHKVGKVRVWLRGVSFVLILRFYLEVHNVNDPRHNMVGEAVEQARANAITLSNNQALRYDYRPPTAKKPTTSISADFIVLPEEP